MIKVLNIISDSNIGGAGKCVLIFGENYDREKVDLTVAVPEKSLLIPELKKRNVKFKEVKYIADCSLSRKGIGELKKLIRELKPDVVHTHASMSGRIAAKLAGVKKIVYTLHCVYEPSKKMKSLPGKLANKFVSSVFSHKIIAVAQAAKDNLTAVGINEKKINVILNGITPVRVFSDDEKASLRKRFCVEDGEKVISIIARLEPVKGHKCFIDAAEIIKKRGYNAKFIIAGTGSAEEELKKYASEKNANVLFTGFINDPESLAAITDISANASYGTEATSISLLEGMSLGNPAVVSDYGGNPGVIQDGVNGFIFPVHDSEAMADKIQLLIDDTKLYNMMSENALRIFEEKFKADVYARNIENIYMS